jgi:hypothetical protein
MEVSIFSDKRGHPASPVGVPPQLKIDAIHPLSAKSFAALAKRVCDLALVDFMEWSSGRDAIGGVKLFRAPDDANRH